MAGPDRDVHRLVSTLDYPMFIVTVAAGGDQAGCLVGFTTQCSVDPPRFLVCLSDKNRTFRVAREPKTMVVHLVPEGRPGDHWAYLLDPTEAHGQEDETPFTFHRARMIEPGHEP